ncbi:MAG TPA: endonuclease/exonuclease/phosphatase family protein [Thermoleophilaceae bacterium]|nr:endonuclease/exonuclease/phosphatase family protein [Thermoleophilaceae bacterium]
MSRRLPQHLGLAVVAALLAALMVVPAAVAKKPRAKTPALKVMTRNIYLGGNIFLPIGARDRAEFEQKTTELWQQIQSTNFPARAKLLAAEIKKTGPDLVGLQEVALWRRSPNGVKDDSATPSTIVVYDFLKILRRELKARGLRYSVPVVQQEADIEAATQQYDVRLTMRDAILVKRKKNGVRVRRKRSKQFKAEIAVPTQGGTFTSNRGWTYVDASFAGRKFRFLNTHLEAFAEAPRVAQAKELVAKGGPARSKTPVILVGDLNSDAQNLTGASPVAYRTLRRFGFRDTWNQIQIKSRGFSCCLRDPLLKDPPPFPGDHRIDHTLVKPRIKGTRAVIVGRDASQRTRGGLWPSDHAGVVTTLRLAR